jgi:hypothetical protein
MPNTLLLLVAGLLPWLLLESRRVVARVSTLVVSLQRPAARASLLIVAGLCVAIHSIVAFERADDASLEVTMAEVERAASRVPLVPTGREWATTDRGTRIVLKRALDPQEGGDLDRLEARFLQGISLEGQVIRQGRATERCNCHGWVFTGGRYFLAPEDVELILAENGYREATNPQAGDLAIYHNPVEIAHTGVVRYVAEGQPVLVESKWSIYGVFLHAAEKSPYGTDYKFHRSTRQGHLLTGLPAR